PAFIPLSTPASVAPSKNVYGNNLEGAVQQIIYMGGDTWDRDIAVKKHYLSLSRSHTTARQKNLKNISLRSARSGILGEATINIGRYYSSLRSSASVSLLLKKCNYGTILQDQKPHLTPVLNLLRVKTCLPLHFLEGLKSCQCMKELTRITHDEQEQEYSESPSPVPQTTSIMNTTSSKNPLEAAEDTIEELLRDESKL
nr:heat shock chaperonin-binding [Tanacetum cinerariifolium]